jgi:Ca-activated chloride channel family protein
MRTRILASLVVVSVLVSFGSAAQERGSLSGVVSDTQGAALPGVTVAVDGPERRTALTDERGAFAFSALLPGIYQLRLTLAGFQSLDAPVQIAAGDNRHLTYKMTLAAVQETVTVGGSSPVTPGVAAGYGTGQGDTRFEAGVAGRQEAPVRIGGASPYPPPPPYGRPYPSPGGEAYASVHENPFRRVPAEPLSTFSIDVDTASYANVRRFLNEGRLPPADAVRIEELVNYFRYSYSQPNLDVPFSVTTEVAECPWNPKHRLALIGLQGRNWPAGEVPPRNLVFLVDVSGSMASPDKLPLVRSAMRMLSDVLTERDRVSVVVYAGSSGLVLPPTRGDDRGRIHRALAELQAGGSTNGGQGIQLAYRIAREQFMPRGINRVIIATDGDFNVGLTSQSELLRLIEEQRASGVFLSVLGVGTGNLKDTTMEMLADKGNGNYAYLDSLDEARRVLVSEAGSTLVTIAKDVKLQVEFNPAHVAGYRLIGYENRLLRNEDFNDDTKDAGEIGAGHSVTALYEIVPVGVAMESPSVDPLKYQESVTPSRSAASNEVLTVKLRYKDPSADQSRLISRTLLNRPTAMTPTLGFASAVAEVGMLLRGSAHAPSARFDAAIARARKFRQDDPDGYRAEFVRLAELAASLTQLDQTARR